MDSAESQKPPGWSVAGESAERRAHRLQRMRDYRAQRAAGRSPRRERLEAPPVEVGPPPKPTADELAIIAMMKRPKAGGYLEASARLQLLDGVALVCLCKQAAQFWPLAPELRTEMVEMLSFIDSELRFGLEELQRLPEKKRATPTSPEADPAAPRHTGNLLGSLDRSAEPQSAAPGADVQE
jgi:hypothetical protein